MAYVSTLAEDAECLSCLLVDLATGVAVRVSPDTRRHLLGDLVRFVGMIDRQYPAVDLTWARELDEKGKRAISDEDWDHIVVLAASHMRESLPGTPRPRPKRHRCELCL